MGDKIWVIHPHKKDKQKESSEERSNPVDPGSVERSVAPEASDSRAQVYGEDARDSEKGCPSLTLLSYLTGPFAVLATRDGRRSKFWISAAIVSCAAWAIILLRANAVFVHPKGAGIGLIIWLLIACSMTIFGFVAWTRAIVLTGSYKGELLRRLPAGIRHPGTAGILGIVVPGLGLFIARYPKRAACALWAFCAVILSALMLSQSPVLWRLNRAAGPLALPGDTFERAFIAIGAIGLLGALIWIVQALDGARLAGNRTGRSSQPQGDLAAVSLLLAIAVSIAMFKPSHVAEIFDRFAVSTQQDGLRIIPLYASQAAMRLDPSQPGYVVHAIEIYDNCGKIDGALAMRQRLAESWKPYERMLRLDASIAGDNTIMLPQPNPSVPDTTIQGASLPTASERATAAGTASGKMNDRGK